MTTEQNYSHPLKEVAAKVLENWAMMLVDQTAETTDLFDNTKPLYRSWVNVHGPINGELSIIAQKDFMELLAQNLLGDPEESEHSTDVQEDAFREMGNVLAGNFFTEAFGEDCVFDLVRPEVTKVDQAELQKVADKKVRFFFLADELPVAVTFDVRE